jgi:formate transporter FocA
MAERAEQTGLKKARLGLADLFALALLAGAFIAFGAIFSTTVVAGAETLPYGLTRLLAGLVFSLGLILVVVGGAELFTGNTLMVMAWASGKISSGLVARNWAVVYVGNLVGAIGTAALVFVSGQYTFGKGAVGLAALATASAKVQLDFVQAVALGTLCNVLVCLAVWLTFSARGTTDRILAIVLPIAAFVAAGFEHSVANMYFIPIGLLIRAGAPASFWQSIGRSPTDYAALTWEGFILGNLLPVTLGNLIGGTLLVGAVYWFIYLRPRHRPTAPLGGSAEDPTARPEGPTR